MNFSLPRIVFGFITAILTLPVIGEEVKHSRSKLAASLLSLGEDVIATAQKMTREFGEQDQDWPHGFDEALREVQRFHEHIAEKDKWAPVKLGWLVDALAHTGVKLADFDNKHTMLYDLRELYNSFYDDRGRFNYILVASGVNAENANTVKNSIAALEMDTSSSDYARSFRIGVLRFEKTGEMEIDSFTVKYNMETSQWESVKVNGEKTPARIVETYSLPDDF